MQPINYFFASVASFSGLLIGLIMVKIAPEEQKPLQKYFALMGKILLLLVFIFLIFYFLNNWIYFTVLAAVFALLLFAEYQIKALPKRLIITYSVLGILFYLSSKNVNLLVMESSLIFLYGLAAAPLMQKKGIFYSMMASIAISNLLFLTI